MPTLRILLTSIWLDDWRPPSSWVHLTELALEDLDVRPLQALRMLVACPNLIEFSASSLREPEHHPAEADLLDLVGTPLRMAQLRSLYVYTTPRSPILLASGLDAPALHDLTLICINQRDWTAEQEQVLGLEAGRYVAAFGSQLILCSPA